MREEEPAPFDQSWQAARSRAVVERLALEWGALLLVGLALSVFFPPGLVLVLLAWQSWVVRQLELGMGRGLSGGERLIVFLFPRMTLACVLFRRPKQTLLLLGLGVAVLALAAGLASC